jgi:aspartate kinase
VGLAKQISSNPNPREYDALVSTGENVSASLLAMAIQALGRDAISLTGYQAGIYTETRYSKAKILDIKPDRILQELERGRVVIVTGFQGVNEAADVTTIGRGGSDTSAVALASALGCSECDIFTDVEGVYTTDPRVVSDATKLVEISYEEMLELASLGARVLHPRAVECAKENDVVLHVRSSFDTVEGTRVKEAKHMEVNRVVTGVTMKDNEAIVSIIGVQDRPGIAGKLFSTLSDVGINVDMIIQSTDEEQLNNITFTIQKDDLKEAVAITQGVADDIGAERVDYDEDVCKVSIVGVGMISKPGVAAKMFEVLGEQKINIKLISTSEIKVSCAISSSEGQHAVRLLHDAFSLDTLS